MAAGSGPVPDRGEWEGDTMARDHERDQAAKTLFDDAARSIRAVLDSKDCDRRLGGEAVATLLGAEDRCRERAAHIVAVWD